MLERFRGAPRGRTPTHRLPQRGGGLKRTRADAITSDVVLNPKPADNPCCLFFCLCKLIGKPTDRTGVDELRLQIANQLARSNAVAEPIANRTLCRWAAAMGFESVRSLIHATHNHPLRPGSRLDLHIVHEFTGVTLWVLDHLDDVLFAIGQFTPNFALRLENMHYQVVKLRPQEAEVLNKRLRRTQESCADPNQLVEDTLSRYLRTTDRIMEVAFYLPIWELLPDIGRIKGVIVAHHWQQVTGADATTWLQLEHEYLELNIPCWAKFISLRLEASCPHHVPPNTHGAIWPHIQSYVVAAATKILATEDP
eukprot:3995435-Amphidinium_carterae.1